MRFTDISLSPTTSRARRTCARLSCQGWPGCSTVRLTISHEATSTTAPAPRSGATIATASGRTRVCRADWSAGASGPRRPMDTTIIRPQTAVPASATLSAWQHHPWSDGVSIDQLSPLDRLIVRTRHSTYEIVATEAGSAEVLVRGGSFFPEFTPVRLAGASLGGSFLKLRSVH